MRELKFRCWNKNNHEYLGEGEGFNMEKLSRLAGQFNKWELEQYTGLKDKRGVEIYEGDIVRLEYYEKPFGKKRWSKTYPRKGSEDRHIVGFDDGYFKFYKRDKDGCGSELSFSDYGEWETKDGLYKYAVEVIGNIKCYNEIERAK